MKHIKNQNKIIYLKKTELKNKLIYMENLPSTKITKEHFEALSSFITMNRFESTSFTKTVSYEVIRPISSKASFSKTPEFLWPRLKNLPNEEIQEINKELEELKNSVPICEKFNIRTNVDVGDQFQPISDITKVFGDEDEKFTVERKDGQVLLVDFWATWYLFFL